MPAPLAAALSASLLGVQFYRPIQLRFLLMIDEIEYSANVSNGSKHSSSIILHKNPFYFFFIFSSLPLISDAPTYGIYAERNPQCACAGLAVNDKLAVIVDARRQVPVGVPQIIGSLSGGGGGTVVICQR
ncbi:hypothetical protein BDV26DRAFT_137555 [Aspergillus bertholletiae]|uniref:Uncharacterized protein n=1 Tax=Aspergillus bertholletiae TaxID=1226010 RepID=A0A5N7BNV5_9EURO|nr:hypothetical protein BDV26DRAFT_137555 [Aspergillus bertholletiae]